MRIAHVSLTSISPYSQSRYFAMDPGGGRHTDKAGRVTESADDHERRTWRMRLHTTSDGRVQLPPMAFKNALSEAARFFGMQIPGKGKATYTKHFEAGVLCVDPLVLNVKAADVPGDWLFVPADGKRGSGKRVLRCFPRIDSWAGVVNFFVLDDVITPDVFETHLKIAGSLIGIGRFRPRNNGFFGRFDVKAIQWQAMPVTASA